MPTPLHTVQSPGEYGTQAQTMDAAQCTCSVIGMMWPQQSATARPQLNLAELDLAFLT